MARRKISIEDALKVLEEAGIPLQAKPLNAVAKQTVEVVEHHASIQSTVPQPVLKQLVKITLYAKHSVGSGGNLTGKEGEKQIEDAGVQSYGPGVCTVPSAIASHLLHADSVAKQADDRMLEKEQRSYLIVQKLSPAGHLTNVGMQVPNSFLDDGMGTIPQEFIHVIR